LEESLYIIYQNENSITSEDVLLMSKGEPEEDEGEGVFVGVAANVLVAF